MIRSINQFLKRSIILLTILFVPVTFSGTQGEFLGSSHFFVTISGGSVWQNGGKTQTFYLAPEVEKTYVTNKSTQALADSELFFGWQKSIKNKEQLQGQLGIALTTDSPAHLSGVIWDDANSLFKNYTYKYDLRHYHIAIKGKLLIDNGYIVTPWISGSMGVGINRSYGFTNTPTIFEALTNANFTSKTVTAYTYTIGVGIQKTLNEHWQAGIGYEFADWGKSSLGRAAGQTMNTGLTLNHLYTNGFLLNITYQV